MARRLGISQPTLNRLANAAQNTTLKTLTTLCRGLGCSVGELFDGDIRLSGRSTISKRRPVALPKVRLYPFIPWGRMGAVPLAGASQIITSVRCQPAGFRMLLHSPPTWPSPLRHLARRDCGHGERPGWRCFMNAGSL